MAAPEDHPHHDIHEPGSGLDPQQLWHYYRRYPYLLAKLAFTGLIVYGVIWALLSVEAVLFPVLVSLLVAYLLDPAVDWFEERNISRTLAILIFLIIGLMIAALFALVLYPTIAGQIANVGERIPQLIDLVETRAIPWIRETFNYEVPATFSAAMAEYGGEVKEQIPVVAQEVSAWVGGLVTSTGAIVVAVLNLVMIPIFVFYFLRDFDRMRMGLGDFIPLRRREYTLERLRRADEVVGAWFRGQLQVAGILAVLYSIGLGIVFGISGTGVISGLAIGMLTGVLNVIPYFGVLIGVVLSVLIALLDWSGIGPLLGVGGVFLVVQLLEGYVITPKIVGEKVGLSPVAVIIVLLLGGELFGLLGILLAIPVAGIVRVLLPDLIAAYRKTPFYTGRFDGSHGPMWARPERTATGAVAVEKAPGATVGEGLDEEDSEEDSEQDDEDAAPAGEP